MVKQNLDMLIVHLAVAILEQQLVFPFTDKSLVPMNRLLFLQNT